jgi:hypothetical protein
LKEAREAIADYLDNHLLRYGRHVDRHGDSIKKFFAAGTYEKSAFIMTKYPEGDALEGDALEAKRLQKVIDLVSQAVAAAGLKPRIAKDANYHTTLWDNVELHALCCYLGVAIAESHYRADFSPNVAMEWGWMRAMGRPVIFLVEKDFKLRADMEGVIRQPFDWDAPDATVPKAIATGIETLRKAGRL